MIDDVALNFSPNSLLLLNGILAVVMFSVAIDLMQTISAGCCVHQIPCLLDCSRSSSCCPF